MPFYLAVSCSTVKSLSTVKSACEGGTVDFLVEKLGEEAVGGDFSAAFVGWLLGLLTGSTAALELWIVRADAVPLATDRDI